MKKFTLLFITVAGFFCIINNAKAQAPDFEWRLTNVVYSSVDPDGGLPAIGSVTFTLQIRTRNAGASIPITGMTTGFAWQSTRAMLPTSGPNVPTCGTNSALQPSNISMSASFPSYTYNNVNQCSGSVNFSTGGQTFDRRAVGTVDGGADVIITNAWTNVFTVTLWSLNSSFPYAGYVVLNSTNAGTPGPFGNYDISDAAAAIYDANSLTYNTPLLLGPPIVTPVLFTYFNANCNDKGALLTWETATENNSDYFEIQKNINGSWKVVDKVDAAGNSDIARKYQYLDLEGGNAQYRLRQVDLDANSVLTEIRATSCEGKSFSTILYPVPAKDKMTLVVRSDRAATTNLQIMDAGGKIIKQVRAIINNGNTNIIIDVSALPQGEYMLMSTDPSIRITKKFVVAR